MAQITRDKILKILYLAWGATEGKPIVDKKIENFTKTDWEATALEIEDLLKGFSLKISGESIADLQNKKEVSTRSTAVYVLAVFILFRKEKLNDSEKNKLFNFSAAKHYFLNKLTEEENWDKVEGLDLTATVPEMNSEEITTSVITSKYRKIRYLALGLLLLVGLGIIGWQGLNNTTATLRDNSKIKFDYSFPKGRDIAATAVFNYDISAYTYDSAFFDYGDGIKLPLKSSKGFEKHTYTAPREIVATIYVDTLRKEIPFIIPSKGWFTIAGADKKFHYFKKDEAKANGQMHLKGSSVPNYVLDSEGHYLTSHISIADFDFDCDNLDFETNVKNPIEEGGIKCFDISIDLVGHINSQKKVISFNILDTTCTQYSRIKIADSEIGYNTSIPNPHPSLQGFNTSQWTKLRFTTKNNVLNIMANSKTLYTLKYRGKVGKLKFIQISFLGTGSIENVIIKNNEGKLLMNEEFN